MTIFASRTDFMRMGLEQVAPSAAIMHQDCYVCKNPLNVNIHATPTDAHHSAIRIGVCGHLHGEECLAAWLQTGNSCPICKRILFEASEHTLSQNDLNSVARTMGPLVGEERVMSAIARFMREQNLERTQSGRNFEEVRETRSRQDALLDDEDWYPSSDEEYLDIDEEAEESDFDMDGQDVRMDEDVDDSVALDEEDKEL